MESILRSLTGQDPNPDDYRNIDFWSDPERSGWLTKQGDYIKTWRRRWFVLKQGKLVWFKDRNVTRGAIPRGAIPVGKCLTVKGAEDVLNKPYAFELSTSQETMFFIADSEKEKEEWINSIGRSIVQQSRSVTDSEAWVSAGLEWLRHCSIPEPKNKQLLRFPAPTKTVHVKFQSQKECVFGEQFLLVGEDRMVGLWDPSSAIPLNWSEGHTWSVDLDVCVNLTMRHRFILKRSTGEIVWQPGPDRTFKTWESNSSIVIAEDWENAGAQKVIEEQVINTPDLEPFVAGC
ncbi:hypothetical protein POTOM_005493 [Populus tomentosa]|uniref:PH domain-containing protein n=1 Tax=Populus tomentosa TaxID=118781 RepID=A0A8X8D6L8_POPTO|nr:hypothetical protein POTOM_005493 [Populus tomentosa]